MFEKFLSATLAWLVAALSVGLAGAADPIPPAEQKQPPRIVASPATVVEQPKPGVPVPCDVGKFIFLELTGYRGDVSWDFSASGIVALLPDAPAGATAEYYPGIKQGESVPVWHKLPSKTSVPCLGVKEGTVTISAWVVVENRAKKAAEITVQVGNGPRPPPDVEPDPRPDDPKPPPVVKSFRVILVHETMETYTAAQRGVLESRSIADYLNAKTTAEGGLAGWRRFDKDQVAKDAKFPTMNALWAAVKPKLTGMPCMVVEVNGKAEILPLPGSVPEALATLKKYGGE